MFDWKGWKRRGELEEVTVSRKAEPGLEIRVFDRAIVYCVDIGMTDGDIVFVRPADTRTFTDLDFQSGCDICNGANRHKILFQL